MVQSNFIEAIRPNMSVIELYVNTGGINAGIDIHSVAEAYKLVDSEPQNLSCGGCVDTMLRRIYDIWKENEKEIRLK